MLVCTETDFDLSKKPPRDGFLHLRHPESFRACLVQVSRVRTRGVSCFPDLCTFHWSSAVRILPEVYWKRILFFLHVKPIYHENVEVLYNHKAAQGKRVNVYLADCHLMRWWLQTSDTNAMDTWTWLSLVQSTVLWFKGERVTYPEMGYIQC